MTQTNKPSSLLFCMHFALRLRERESWRERDRLVKEADEKDSENPDESEQKRHFLVSQVAETKLTLGSCTVCFLEWACSPSGRMILLVNMWPELLPCFHASIVFPSQALCSAKVCRARHAEMILVVLWPLVPRGSYVRVSISIPTSSHTSQLFDSAGCTWQEECKCTFAALESRQTKPTM